MYWEIWYSNGSKFSSEDCAWEDAPGRDVQIILFWDPDRGWMMRHGANTKHADFFRVDEDGTVVCMSLDGFIDHVVYELKLAEPRTDLPTLIDLAVHEFGVVKQGRMLSQNEWDAVLRAATIELRRLQVEEPDGPTIYAKH